MARIRLVFVLLAIALVGAGAALAGRIVEIGQLANGKTIVLNPSDRLVVSLPGNASTGYFWRIQKLNRRVVKFISRTYVPPSPGKTGSTGKYVLRFRAVAVGTTPLRLAYVQSGNTSAKPAKTFRVSLTVKSKPPVV
jgi:predicted secreted protein